MKIVLQRVKEAKVVVDGKTVGSIQKGLLALLGIHKEDTPEKIAWGVNKLVNLRIFSDAQDKMNLSLKDIQGEALIVSQFTLYGNCVNGRRPDFMESAPPSLAEALYENFLESLKKEGVKVESGVFGAYMEVSLINDGPVTLLLEN